MKKLLTILYLVFTGYSFAQTGSSCATPFSITTLPYNMAGINSSSFGNNYSSLNACNSVFMNGNDVVFEYTPTTDTCVTITLNNTLITTGLFLVKNCPDLPYATCISSNTGDNVSLTESLEQDSTYYIIVSTDSFPASTTFGITIQGISCQVFDPRQNCVGATIICQDYFEPSFFSEDGSIHEEVPNGSCLGSGEKNAVWYQFTSYQSGFLGFTIFPNTPSDDYDWAVYDITDNGCMGVPSGLSPEVSCNYSGNVCPPPGGDGSTGPNGILTGPCSFQNEPLIPVDSGDTYVIVVSQFTDASQDGFTISFDTNGVISANTIDALDETVNCGDQIILEANFNGPVDDTLIYAWSPAIKLDDSTLVNPTTVPLDSSINYIVKVKNGICELIDTVNVEITYADFTTLQDTSLCFGVDYTIVPEFEDDIDVSSLVFNWTPDIAINSVSDSNPTITTFDTITYHVEIVNGICYEYDSINIIVSDSLAAVPNFFINDNFESGGVAEVEFYSQSIGSSIDHFWNFADGNTSELTEPLHVYTDEGTYPVILTVVDTLGCVDSVVMNVVIPVLELPNIFTPNGDDLNDIFSIDRLRPESNLKIYNKWGRLVREFLDYDNSWNGDDLVDGTYFAELSYQKKGEVKTFKGWFEIKR